MSIEKVNEYQNAEKKNIEMENRAGASVIQGCSKRSVEIV